jgi:hypothetical protein
VSLESVGRFCVGAFGRNLASVPVKLFSRLIYLKRKCITVKFRVFLDVAPCIHVEVDRRFRGAYCLYHQDDDGGSTYL